MSADLIPFAYGDQPVRVVTVDGEPWFVLADLCRVLDLTNPTMVAERLDPDGLSTAEVIDSMGRMQSARIVSESGMYEVVFLSRKPEAATFRRWITSEVLPSIRKTGAYGVPALSGPALMAAALMEADRTMRALTATVDDQRAQLAIAGPKAAAFDRWMGSGAEYSIDTAAKALAESGYMTGRNRLFGELEALGWAYRAADGWHHYQAHGPEGTKRLAVRVFYYDDSKTGEAKGKTTLKITAKGLTDLARLHSILPEVVREHIEAA